ncbi:MULTISPECIES: WYL domain-containing protein [unclassified Streptomyces]|uniref:helix-turn-helix transcriptional regulator n=1 Tax=unclassified Streptomyces TaxID=2593676 RepID=UPI00380A4E31
MRAARLIHLVLLLQSHGSMTSAELAGALEVSERTVGRDVQALSEAGVPVYAERGRAGGYRLVDGYRTRLTGLARAEAEALFLSGVPAALEAMGLHDAGSAARLKVAAALLPELRDAPRAAAQRFHLDAPGWWQEPATPPLLPALAEAVWGDRRLRARYRRADTEVARELEPYALVLKAGVWYAVARADGARGAEKAPGAEGSERTEKAPGAQEAERTEAAERTERPEEAKRVERTERAEPTEAGKEAKRAERAEEAVRVYRVDRFTAAEVLPERFVRDPAFDLPAFWEARAAAFARSVLRAEVVLRLTPDGARHLPYVADAAAARDALAAAAPPGADGRVTVTLAVESLDVAYHQLLALGPGAELLSPAPLRARFAEAARAMAAAYAG